MTSPAARVHTDRLRSLHRRGDPLVLANVWDATGARLVVEAGFPVVATTSLAVADSLGYADHQQAPPDEMFAAAARIARVVGVPFTVDAEAGYDLPPEQLVGRLIDCGAHGFNIEDTDHRSGSLLEASVQAARIAELRRAIDASDVPLVLNARVDVFVGVTEPDEQLARVAAAVDRARRYIDAGADCVYPILVSASAALDALMSALDGAVVNLLVRAGPDGALPSLERARELGAARASVGPGLWRGYRDRFVADLATLTETPGGA